VGQHWPCTVSLHCLHTAYAYCCPSAHWKYLHLLCCWACFYTWRCRLRNAPAMFQRLMKRLVSCLEGCSFYLDDLVIYSDTWHSHLQPLCALFEHLAEVQHTYSSGPIQEGCRQLQCRCVCTQCRANKGRPQADSASNHQKKLNILQFSISHGTLQSPILQLAPCSWVFWNSVSVVSSSGLR